MVDVPDRLRPYLRRAYSVADAAPQAGTVEFLLKTIGRGTAALEELPIGAPVRLLGPLGNAFTVSDLPRGSRVAIVAGGIGAAPFPALLKALASAGAATDFYFGGRNARELALAQRFAGAVTGETILSSDDGSLGEKGLRHAGARAAPRGRRGVRACLCLRPDADVRGPRQSGRTGRDLLGVLDRGGDGVRVRRVPGMRHPGDGEAVHRVLQRRADFEPGEDHGGEDSVFAFRGRRGGAGLPPAFGRRCLLPGVCRCWSASPRPS